jgi:arylsulfatase A-like enzyme
MKGILKSIGYGCAISPAFLLVNCSQKSVSAEQDKPNIILCMADDQGWGDMGYNGHPVIKTPNFDNMAKSGLRFDRFYSASPVSSPTRGSVMTGRNPNRFGCFSWGRMLRPQEITVAEALKTAGYVTGHFGKWHLGPVRKESPVSPGNSGFDEWLSSPNFFDNDPILSREGKAVKTHGESSMVTVDAAIEFIRKHSDAKKPFLAVVWFGSPHNPHIAAEEELIQYSGLPENLQHYYGEISGMDRAFGKLRQELQTLGIKENTILWYCSDNGGQSDKYSVTGGRGYKGQVWEGGLRVPAILEWPARIPEPRITNIPCNTYDIYPTLLDITGMSVKDQPELDGISLTSLINNKMKNREKPMGFWHHTIGGIPVPSDKLMSEMLDEQEKGITIADTSLLSLDAGKITTRHDDENYPGHAAWLDWPYKLHRINLKDEKVRFELYNLEKDPMEKNDIYTIETDKSKKMKQEIEQWLKSVVSSLNGDDYE